MSKEGFPGNNEENPEAVKRVPGLGSLKPG